MKTFRITTILLFLTIISFSAKAQIGYQVSLLNNATGEPRANESVNVTVKITDSAGNVICEQTKHETTNDFGILSMSVGNAETFADANWSKLPFFIEANIAGRLIGRSQLLSVPVAEHAKHTGTLTKEILCGKTWKHTANYSYGFSTTTLIFHSNGTVEKNYYSKYNDEGRSYTESTDFKYYIDGNNIAIISNDSESSDSTVATYVPERGIIFSDRLHQ